jgi:hypothetical protein
MTVATRTEPMGKQQRSVHLPPDIYAFAEAFEAKSGHKFNRIVLASLLKFFLEEFHEVRVPEWISWAASVERGEFKIEDLPLMLAQFQVKELQNVVGRKEIRDILGIAPDEARRRLADAEERLHKWQHRAKDAGDNRKALIANIAPSVRFRMVEEFDPRDLLKK